MNTIFLSSTFNDMQNERDAFHRVILPQLNQTFAKYGEVFQICDLRWGIDTTNESEENSTVKILKVCFSSIKRAIPLFIVLLGDRYGWIPPKDTNKALEPFGLQYHEQSVTEMEIEYQSIINSNSNYHALYFFRNSIPQEQMSAESRELYFSSDSQKKEKLKTLKDRIRRENPGAVFDYSVAWNEDTQDYTTEEFCALVSKTVSQKINEILEERPVPTSEEIVLNESAAYYKLRADLIFGNNDILIHMFRDLLTQIKGNHEFANEKWKAELEAAGELEKWENQNHYDPFRAAILSNSQENDGFNAGVYELILQGKMDMDDDKHFFPIPFVADINGDAHDGNDLLACIIRAVELKIMEHDGVERKRDTDITACVKKIINYEPSEIYSIGSTEQNRDYLGELLNHLSKRKLIPFLLVDHFERMTDPASINFTFMPIGVRGTSKLYMILKMCEDTYSKLKYLHSLNGHFVYKLKEVSEQDKQDYVQNFFAMQYKEISPAVVSALTSRPESTQGRWLNEACSVLSEMDAEDFRKVRSIGDGASAIEKVLISKIDSFPSETYDIVLSGMLEYSNMVSGEMVELILKILSLSAYAIPVSVMEAIAEKQGIVWNSLDFELFTSRFSQEIKQDENGAYGLFDNILKENIRSRLDANTLFPLLVNEMKTHPSTERNYIYECISLAARTKDAMWLWQLIGTACSAKDRNTLFLASTLCSAIKSDSSWLINCNIEDMPTYAVEWFCSDFYRSITPQDGPKGMLPVLMHIYRNPAFSDYARACAADALCYEFDRQKQYEKTSELFAETMPIIRRLLTTRGAEAVDMLSYYARRCVWYRPEEKEKYAQMAYEYAKDLPISETNASAVILAMLRRIIVFSEKMSIEETSDAYQEIFEYYENPEANLCYRYPGKRKRDFFFDLKINHRKSCTEICDRYASFLAKNRKKVPEGTTVPCSVTQWYGTKGDLYSKADGVEYLDSADYTDASLFYRKKAILLAAKLYDTYHDVFWLRIWTECNFDAASLMRQIGQTKFRTGDAYEYYENAVKGYTMLEKSTDNTVDIEQYKRHRGEALTYMGRISKGFTDKAYAQLPGKNYNEAYEILSEISVDTLKPYYLDLLAECSIAVGHFDKALSALNAIPNVSSRLYYMYYSCFFNACKPVLEKMPVELTERELNTVALTSLAIAHHFFYELSPEQAKKTYTGNKTVLTSAVLLYDDAPLPHGHALLRKLNGYCFEYLYNSICGRDIMIEAADSSLKKQLESILPAKTVASLIQLLRSEDPIGIIRNTENIIV